MVLRSGILILASLMMAHCRDPRAAAETGMPSRRVGIVPFRSEYPGRELLGGVLADSLVARLEPLPSLSAGVGTSGSDYTIQGDIAIKDNRLVIAARLYETGGAIPLWSATFWRKDSLTTELVGDLAAGIAEALLGHMGRAAIGTTKEKP